MNSFEHFKKIFKDRKVNSNQYNKALLECYLNIL